jgi:hypothetical protein
MRRRIAGADRLIARTRHDRIVKDGHGANRHLTGSEGEPRLFERSLHEVIVSHPA